jgi:hypothetical protein
MVCVLLALMLAWQQLHLIPFAGAPTTRAHLWPALQYKTGRIVKDLAACEKL